ncbi:hypothetical protein HDV57DRAFT_488154 [Trichoderma longibrachiatum]
MARSRRRYNRNRELGIKNRVRGIIKKAHDLAQCYGVEVDVHIQLENDFAAGYQSIPGRQRQRTAIPRDQLFGPEDFVSQNEKYEHLLSAQLPRRSTSASPSTSSASNIASLPYDSPNVIDQSNRAPCEPRITQLYAGETTPMAIEPHSSDRRTFQVSHATAPVSIQQAREILHLVQKYF